VAWSAHAHHKPLLQVAAPHVGVAARDLTLKLIVALRPPPRPLLRKEGSFSAITAADDSPAGEPTIASKAAGDGDGEMAGGGDGAAVSAPPKPPKHCTRGRPAEELRPEPPPAESGDARSRGAKCTCSEVCGGINGTLGGRCITDAGGGIGEGANALAGLVARGAAPMADDGRGVVDDGRGRVAGARRAEPGAWTFAVAAVNAVAAGAAGAAGAASAAMTIDVSRSATPRALRRVRTPGR